MYAATLRCHGCYAVELRHSASCCVLLRLAASCSSCGVWCVVPLVERRCGVCAYRYVAIAI